MTRACSGPLLIVRLSALGDILHTLPAAMLLRKTLSEQFLLGWVVEAPYRELVELTSPADRVFTVATRRWRRSPMSRATLAEVRASRDELQRFARGAIAVDFQGLLKSAVLAYASGARERFGFRGALLRERAASLFINRPVTVDSSTHVVDWNLALARSVCGGGAEVTGTGDPWPDLRRFPADPQSRLTNLQGRVVLNPGAGQLAKMWPAEKFTRLAERLRSDLGVEPLVVWGPGEKSVAIEISGNSPALLSPETNLRELAFLVERARVVVSADSGPLHLAAAMRVPVVGLYGPTSLIRNGPYHQLDSCVQSGSNRMEEITVDAVMSKVKETLR